MSESGRKSRKIGFRRRNGKEEKWPKSGSRRQSLSPNTRLMSDHHRSRHSKETMQCKKWQHINLPSCWLLIWRLWPLRRLERAERRELLDGRRRRRVWFPRRNVKREVEEWSAVGNEDPNHELRATTWWKNVSVIWSLEESWTRQISSQACARVCARVGAGAFVRDYRFVSGVYMCVWGVVYVAHRYDPSRVYGASHRLTGNNHTISLGIPVKFMCRSHIRGRLFKKELAQSASIVCLVPQAL